MLLEHDSQEVAVIDTTGSFDFQRVLHVLGRRIRYAQQTSGTLHDDSSPAQAITLLERVRLSRVFNLTGLIEVVEEIKHILVESDHAVIASEANISENQLQASLAEQNPLKPQGIPEHRLSGRIVFLIIDNVTNVLGAELSIGQIHGTCHLEIEVQHLFHINEPSICCIEACP